VGCSLCDFYVRLPLNKKYVSFVPTGFPYTYLRRTRLLGHSDNKVYARKDEVSRVAQSLDPRNVEKIFAKGDNKSRSDAFLNLLLKKDLDIPPDEVAEINDIVNKKLVLEAMEAVETSSALKMSTSQSREMVDEIKFTTAMALHFASQMGKLTERSIQDIANACLLKDVAILNVDPELVNEILKTGEPKNPEFKALYFNHPVVSRKIMQDRSSGISSFTSQLIVAHHEYVDGSGFPNGLKGDAISQLGQVLSLAGGVVAELQRHRIFGTETSAAEVLRKMLADSLSGKSRRHAPKVLEKICKAMLPESSSGKKAA
jgi:response regulator RpfG family c-di-GMP phosphodiesterase